MNILIVDDQAEIREIVSLLVNHELNAKIETASSGNAAVDILRNKNFDLVICDYSMQDGNGLVVHDYLKSSSPTTKFVFCSAETDDVLAQADHVFFHIRKPNIYDYIKVLKEKIQQTDGVTYQYFDFTEISLSLSSALSPLPFDLYIKLSDNKFVKYFATDYFLSDKDIETIHNKNLDSLYVKSSEMVKAKDKFLILIQTSLNHEESDHAGQISVATQEYVTKYFQEFGYDSQVQEMATQSLHKTIEYMMKVKDLDEHLIKMLKLSSYSRKLYAVTVCFSAALLKSVKLLNDQTLEKMISAIYLQDLFVTKSQFLPLYTKFEAEAFEWANNREQEMYFMHPVKASDFVKKSKSIPHDVDRLIMESHELPSGKGFPRGLTSSQISPLSCVLILSNLLAREFLRFETAFSTVEYLEFLNRKHGLDQGQFKKVYDAALSIDFFPKK